MTEVVFSQELVSALLSDQPYTLRAIADDKFYQLSENYGEFTVSKKGSTATVEFTFTKPLPGAKYSIEVYRSDNDSVVVEVEDNSCDFGFDPSGNYKLFCIVTLPAADDVLDCAVLSNFVDFCKENPDLTMTFEVGGDEIKAVTALMMSRSPVIKAMMESDCVEAKTTIVKIEDFSSNVVKGFVRFCENNSDYCEDVDEMDLYRIADKYDVEPLRRCAARLIIKSIDGENVVELFEFARTYHCLEVEKRCIEFADAHFTEILETADISDVKSETMKDFWAVASEYRSLTKKAPVVIR